MLGRLIQGYGKGSSTLESTTEEAHSRSLLWPSQPVDYTRGLPSSPPSTPVSSPTFRIGPFDDRGGIEVNEARDLRIIIAQDAFGSLDKQLVLFDSHKPTESAGGRTAAPPKATPRENVKNRSQAQSTAAHQRNRSSTIAGPASAWARQARDPDAGDKVNRLLECMFGNTSTTKSDSSTKMHILSSARDVSERDSNPKPSTTRPPVFRALTSSQAAAGARDQRAASQDSNSTEDVILITRLFSVPLPDSKEPVPPRPKSGDQSQSVISPMSEDGPTKKTKLIEKKTPMYAVGLLVMLPQEDVRPSFSRPPSRMSIGSSSFPNSFGSDFASSWTLLEAISDSLASSTRSAKPFDRRIDALTNIWDAILSGLSDVETVAKTEIKVLLQLVNREVMSSMVKTPKGPYEQRTNQRNIYLSQSLALAHVTTLSRSCKHLVHRLSLALRIPKVVTGSGFLDGHWIDEARYLVQLCGSRTQNYFFFNLLTSFLGEHTEWLEGSPSRWPAKGMLGDEDAEAGMPARSRTVIVADQRSLARRLIFLLASFFPTPLGANPFEQPAMQLKSPLPTPGLASSSPLKHVRYPDGRNADASRSAHHVSFGALDTTQLSTSASSVGSAGTGASVRRTRPRMERKDSDSVSIMTSSRFPLANSSTHMRKASAANAVTPNPATSLPYNSGTQDSYFPESAVTDGSESVASDQLAKILRRDSSNTAPPRSASGSWAFLGLWPRRPTTPSGSTESRTLDRRTDSSDRRPDTARRELNKLEYMVGEAASVAIPARSRTLSHAPDTETAPRELPVVGTPRLKVDEEDGVVDVEIGIPGFLGWEGDDGPLSPPPIPHNSMPGRSYDGGTSMRSSFSHATTPAGAVRGEETNVGGYLKHYHEDFRLQAVRPYAELVAEIKDSMLRESNTRISRGYEFGAIAMELPAESWMVVSSTLLVDVRKFTVERLMLQRKTPAQKPADPTTPGSPIAQTAPTQEYRFVNQSVTEFDPTLAEAIEGLLDLSRGPFHSRSASGAASIGVATPPGSYGRDNEARPRFPRANCRQVIAEALEQVVKGVSEGLANHENGRAITQATEELPRRGKGARTENALREGVKQWLLRAEARAA